MSPDHRKPPADRHDSVVVLRVRRTEKARWVHTAQRASETLAAWIRKTLNHESDKTS